MDNLFIGCLAALIIILVVGAIEGLIFMWLWNWLVPLLWSSAPIFTFWQAWGILVLLHIIFTPLKQNSNK
jgi:hypothetical protein